MIEISLEELKKYYVCRDKIEECVRFLESEAKNTKFKTEAEPKALLLCAKVLREKILK